MIAYEIAIACGSSIESLQLKFIASGKIRDHRKVSAIDCGIVVGINGITEHKGIAALVGEKGVGRQHVFARSGDQAELVAAMQAATVFVYPSSYEGFGLPAGEAMAW